MRKFISPINFIRFFFFSGFSYLLFTFPFCEPGATFEKKEVRESCNQLNCPFLFYLPDELLLFGEEVIDKSIGKISSLYIQQRLLESVSSHSHDNKIKETYFA